MVRINSQDSSCKARRILDFIYISKFAQ